MALTPEELEELKALEQDEEVQTFLSAEQKKESEPETGMLEAGARGLAQGLTAGFADEATALAESALTPKTYEQALEESRAEYKKAEEEYPITSTLGDVAGGLTQAVGLSVLGTPAAGAAAGAGKIAKGAQLLKNILNPATKAGLFKNIGSAALAGAAQGGLQAVGRSEKQGLKRLKEAPGGVLSGAAVGGGLAATLGVGGKILKKAGEKVSKLADEGKGVQAIREIVTGFETGKSGRGFASPANIDRTIKEAFDVAENTIKPEIKNDLSKIREFRDTILDRSTAVTDISDIIKMGNKELKDIKDIQVDRLRSYIKNEYEVATRDGELTLGKANQVAKKIKDFIEENPELTSAGKKIGYKIANDIKNNIRMRAPDTEVLKIITDDPKLVSQYKKFVRDISPEDLADALKSKLQMPDTEAVKKAKDIRKVFKIMQESFQEEDPEVVTSMIASKELKAELEKALSLTSPLKILDEKMANLLNASELMGDVISGKSEAERLDDVVKIFKNIVEQPKDSVSAFLAKERFSRTLENIRNASPELADKIERAVKPVVKNLRYQRYILGEGFEKGGKESGLIKGTIGDVGRLAAEGANLAAQTTRAANLGVAGPIPFTSTLIRPTTSILQSAKVIADDVVSARPESNVWKTISETIEKALNEKDENRRAALLNTLMQYESFRNIITPFEEE